MSPADFEHHCAALLHDAGWRARRIGAAGDQGADIIARLGKTRLAVQCKLYRAPVGNGAVQQAHAARAFHRTDHAVVVSQSGYTRSAQALATTTGVRLLAPADLMSLADCLGIDRATRTCWNCQVTLRIPRGTWGRVQCPRCGHRAFFVTIWR